jgi:hypothetical protein
MTEVARLLLDAGAPLATVLAPGQRGQSRAWSALFCAVAGTSNEPIIRLLLERGARPDDHTLYLAAFGPECLRLLVPDIAESTTLAAPISVGNVDGVRLLLEHGADPDAPGQDGCSPYRLAVRQGRAEVAHLLARYGAATTPPTWIASCPPAASTITRGRTADAARPRPAAPAYRW